MATYFVSSGGSNTSPYDTWAKAATSLQTALTAASTAGDVVVLQYNAVPSADSAVAVDTTYTIANGVSLIAASNDGGTAYTPTPMGTVNGILSNNGNAAWIDICAASGGKAYVYGITIAHPDGNGEILYVGNKNNDSHTIFDACIWWSKHLSTNHNFTIGNAGNHYVELHNCTFKVDRVDPGAAPAFYHGQFVSYHNHTYDFAGTAASIPFAHTSLNIGREIRVENTDLSMFGGLALITDDDRGPSSLTLIRCKLASGYPTPLATQTNTGKASARVHMYDCDDADNHFEFGYWDTLGSVTIETGIYRTSGAAGLSWKVTTTANANKAAPFVTPWIDLYHAGTSAINPAIEVLRNNGTATKYSDHEVWAEFDIKETAGSTKATRSGDRASLANWLAGSGTAQADGVGTSAWTNPSPSSPASFKCDAGGNRTPAETGHIRARICVAVPNTTVYVDPEIRI